MIVEANIVPRLIQARRAQPLVAVIGTEPSAEIVSEFTAVVLLDDPVLVTGYVEALHVAGASLQALYLGLLTATARHLGDMWEDDTLDFTRVTLGLYRLHQLLREFSARFQEESSRREHGRRALLVSAPGEQHGLGLSMLGEFFYRAGWGVSVNAGITLHDLGEVVNGEWFSMVGLSLSCEARLANLVSSIRLIRRASRNRAVAVMVGGPYFVAHPELVATVGADATASDAQQAVLQAEALLQMPGRRG